MKNRRAILGVALAASLLLVPVMAQAQTLAFNPLEDNFVLKRDANGVQGTGGSSTTLLLKSGISAASSFHRKVYMKFDLSSLVGSVNSASLKLNFVDTAVGNLNALGLATTFNFEVFALPDTGDAWSENAITWNNAPNNNTTNHLMGAGATSVGTFSVTGKGVGTQTVSLTGLPSYLNGGGNPNGTLSLVVIRNSFEPNAQNNYSHGFSSSEEANAALVPELTVEIPEPSSVALCALGGVVFLRRLRRKK